MTTQRVPVTDAELDELRQRLRNASPTGWSSHLSLPWPAVAQRPHDERTRTSAGCAAPGVRQLEASRWLRCAARLVPVPVRVAGPLAGPNARSPAPWPVNSTRIVMPASVVPWGGRWRGRSVPCARRWRARAWLRRGTGASQRRSQSERSSDGTRRQHQRGRQERRAPAGDISARAGARAPRTVPLRRLDRKHDLRHDGRGQPRKINLACARRTSR